MPDRDPKSDLLEQTETPPGHSTGPTSEHGKYNSSRNATRHGCCANTLILPDESEAEYRQLLDSWMADYDPATHSGRTLVREVCTAQWFLIRNRGRFNRVEQILFNEQPDCALWSEAQHKQLERFQRYLTQAERRFHRCLADLEFLRNSRVREALATRRTDLLASQIELRRAQFERDAAAPPPPPPPAAAETSAPKASQAKAKKPKKLAILEQWVEIVIEDGQTVTRLFPSNKNLLERTKDREAPPDLVYRRMHFVNGVPDEYDWVGLEEEQRPLGGVGIQRMAFDTWLAVIAREAPEIPREGYMSSIAPGHLQPTGVGNLPRPKERGGCKCPTCTHNQALLDAQQEMGDIAG